MTELGWMLLTLALGVVGVLRLVGALWDWREDRRAERLRDETRQNLKERSGRMLSAYLEAELIATGFEAQASRKVALPPPVEVQAVIDAEMGAATSDLDELRDCAS